MNTKYFASDELLQLLHQRQQKFHNYLSISTRTAFFKMYLVTCTLLQAVKSMYIRNELKYFHV